MDARPTLCHGAAMRTRRLAAAALLALAPLLDACAHSPPPPVPGLASVEVLDRHDSRVLETYYKDGTRYVVGTPGHEYTVRIRNLSPARILVVTSVDGVNAISGETAAPGQSGYVLDPYGSVDVSGWRKSLDRTAAFYFTDLGDSYAARTGRPANVGVIGVAVFRERERVAMPMPYPRDRIVAGAGRRFAESDAPGPIATPAPPLAQPREQAASPEASATDARSESGRLDAQGAPMAKSLGSPLGTGHGRSESSHAQLVRFERATANPAETIAIRYDRYENLLALGVIPGPRYAERAPNPFPGLRFAPDPR